MLCAIRSLAVRRGYAYAGGGYGCTGGGGGGAGSMPRFSRLNRPNTISSTGQVLSKLYAREVIQREQHAQGDQRDRARGWRARWMARGHGRLIARLPAAASRPANRP